MTNVKTISTDPKAVIARAEEIKRIGDPEARRFHAKLLQKDLRRAQASNQAVMLRAVNDAEQMAFKLGKVSEMLDKIIQTES